MGHRFLILPSFKQDVLIKNVFFSPMRSVKVAIKQKFFALNYFCEPKLVRTLLMFLK